MNVSRWCSNRDTWTGFPAGCVQVVLKSGHLDWISRWMCPGGAQIGTPGQDFTLDVSRWCSYRDTWPGFPVGCVQVVLKSGHLDRISRRVCPGGAQIGTPGQDFTPNVSRWCSNRDTWTGFHAECVQVVLKSGHLDLDGG